MNLLTYKNIKYFQSDLLKDNNFKHAFFTKISKKNKPMEIQNELNLTSNIHYLRQVNSNKVIQVNNRLSLRPKTADSLITKEKNQSLWIYTADCMPILIADVKTRNIAACHTGLIGLKKQIISKTLKKLEGIGSKKNNLIIAIGPSIHGDKYKVKKEDIKDLFSQITCESNIRNNCFKLERYKFKEEINPFSKNLSDSETLLVDIKAAAKLQLFKEGIHNSQINLNRICTYSNPNLFNSYRRNKTNSRQWSCIYS